jgi:hypothetical protein
MTNVFAQLRHRWHTAALAASLVLNAFLIGVLVVDSLSGHPRSGGPRIVNFELRRLAERLPSEALNQVAAELAPRAPEFDARFEKLRALRDEINGLAAVASPDRLAIDARLAELRSEWQKLQADVQHATFDAILKLPPEVRAGLAQRPKSG